MPKKISDNICVSLDDNILKVAQIQSGKKSSVSNIAAKSLEGVKEADIPRIIGSVLRGLKAKPSNLTLVLPSSVATTKNIEIPSVNDDEIKSIVNLQAGRHSPFSREEIQIGYINIGVFKANYTRVLLIIVNKKVIKDKLSLFHKAGYKIEHISFGAEAVSNLYSEALGLSGEPAPSGIIDISESYTEFVMTFQGKAIMSRSIPVGRIQLASDAQTAKDKLIEEISKTIESYKTEDIGEAPSNYLITCDDASIQALQEALRAKLEIQAEIISYVDYAQATKNVLSKMGKEYAANNFLDLIATGLFMDKTEVDLMPEDIKIQRNIEDQGAQFLKAASLGFLFLILLACSLFLKTYFKQSYYTTLTEKYENNRQEVVSLEDQSRRVKIIRNYLDTRMKSLDVIKQLNNTIPKEIYLTGIFLDEEGNISIQGISDISSLIHNLVTRLKESPEFSSVNLKSSSSKKDRGKNVHAFEITLKIKDMFDDLENVQETEE